MWGQGYQITAEYDPSKRAIPIHIWHQNAQNNIVSAAAPLTFDAIDEGAYSVAALHITIEAANQLMDDLWRAGVRPTGVRNQSELVDAKDKHIDDLRAITTTLLGKVTR